MGVKERYEQRYGTNSTTEKSTDTEYVGTAERHRRKLEEEQKKQNKSAEKTEKTEKNEKTTGNELANPWIVKAETPSLSNDVILAAAKSEKYAQANKDKNQSNKTFQYTQKARTSAKDQKMQADKRAANEAQAYSDITNRSAAENWSNETTNAVLQKAQYEQEISRRKTAQNQAKYNNNWYENETASIEYNKELGKLQAQKNSFEKYNKSELALSDPEIVSIAKEYSDALKQKQNRRDLKKELESRGYDAEEIITLYRNQELDSVLENPNINSLVKQLYDINLDIENAQIGGAENNPYTASQAQKKLEVIEELEKTGYSSVELLDRYARKINAELNAELDEKVVDFGEKHPVAGFVAQPVLNTVGGIMGLGAANDINTVGFDPNSPSYIAQRTSGNLHQGAYNYIDEHSNSQLQSFIGKKVYDLTLMAADMYVGNKFAGAIAQPLQKATYTAIMAARTASDMAQSGAERGLSTGEILVSAAGGASVSAAVNYLGFDNVFKPVNAETFKGILKNYATGFMSEGSEELAEEVGASLFDFLVARDKSEYYTQVKNLVNQGYSESEAKSIAASEWTQNAIGSFVMGGFAGGLHASVNSMPGYIENRFGGADINTPVSSEPNISQNAENSAPNPNATKQISTIPVQEQNAPTGEILSNNELDDFTLDENDFYDSQRYAAEIENEAAANEGFIFRENDSAAWQEVEALLNSIDSEKAYTLSETISQSRAVMSDQNATPEQRNTAHSNAIKAQYDAETYEGIKGEIVERSNSGMSVDTNILVDPIGVKVSPTTQAERKIVDLAKNKFGKTVQFVDDIKGSNGFLKDGIIYISRKAESAVTTVFGHEFTHTLEGTTEYRQLLSHMKINDTYLKSKMQEAGVDWNGLVALKKSEYASALGKEVSTAEAEMELIADAVGAEFFSDYDAMLNLATQNRSVFQRLKQWFERNFTNTLTRKMSESKAEKQTYKLLLGAEQAAKQSNTPSKTKNMIDKSFSNKFDSWINSGTNNPKDVKYSAKKIDVVKSISEDYGFSDISAQKLVGVAASMKKSAGSKADLNELAVNIANAVTNAKNGTVSDSDIDSITKLIADNAKTKNEAFLDDVAPVLEYLANSKISISQTDIADLEDSFVNIRRRAFPYTNISKEGGVNIDELYQELSLKFPEWFNAEEKTHPADQLNSVVGFIEYVKEHRTINTYAEEDAYLNLRNEVATALSVSGESSSTYVSQLIELCKAYGELKNDVPKSTDGQTRVRKTAASVNGTQAVQGNSALRERFAKEVVNGKFNYEVQLQGKEAVDYINSIKSAPDVAQAFEAEYRRCYDALAGKNPTAQDVLHASSLLPLASEYLTEDNFIHYTSLLSEVGTHSGRIISALRYIGQMNGMQRLKMYENKLNEYNNKLRGKYAGDTATGGTFDQNGQIEENSDTTDPSVSILLNTKNADKFQPIEIPSDLRERLIKSQTQEEANEIIGEINDYVSSQMQYSFWDKLNAWRFFAMLSNPKTWIRNAVGNTVMLGASRAKDIVATAISQPIESVTKKVLGKGYTDTNPQTTSIRKSAEAKHAAKMLMANDNTIEQLFSGQDKWSGKSGMQLMQQKNALSNTPVIRNLVAFEEKALSDQPFRLARAKSVLAQSIHANVKNGKIKDINDFIAVALNQNTEGISNRDKIEYKRLYYAFCKVAAHEGDESTFRDENKLINDINKFKRNHKVTGGLSEGAVAFLKTPANIVKRGVEYNPLGLIASLTKGTYDLKKGEIDVNQYVNNIAKGLSGTALMAVGAALGAIGVLSAGNDDEEDDMLQKLENSQEYAINIGGYSVTLDWLTPASLSLFSGVKLAERITSMMSEDSQLDWSDLLSCAEVLLDVVGSTADPMFNLTMLDGINGAIDAIVAAKRSGGQDEAAAATAAFVEYCAENWLVQIFPSVTSALARTFDDTVRTYYTDKGSEIPAGTQSFLTTVKKKIPGAIRTNPAYLDIWGQPKSNGSFAERAVENFALPFYIEKETDDKSTNAIKQFAEDNDMSYSDVMPKTAKSYTYKFNGETIYLNQEEYEKMSEAIGSAQKEAVEKHLVRGVPVSIEYSYTKFRSDLKSGKSTVKTTFTGNLATAHNTNGWNETDEIEYSYKTDTQSGVQSKKAVGVSAASDEDFRAMLYKKMMSSVAESAKDKALYEIMQERKNKE